MARNIDGIFVHGDTGTLSTTRGAKLYPARVTDFVPHVIDVDLPHVRLIVLADNVHQVRLRNFHLACCYSHFYTQCQRQVSPGQLVAALYSIIANVSTISSDIMGLLGQGFQLSGFHLDVEQIVNQEGLERWGQECKVEKFFEVIGPNAHRLVRDRKLMMVLIGPLMLLMAKSLNNDSYNGWLKNRIRGFSGVLAVNGDEVFSEGQYPDLTRMSSANRLLSAFYLLRLHLFEFCSGLGSIGNSFTNNLFREVIHMLAGTEMGHISLIDYYIFTKYPEFLRIRVVRDSCVSFLKAWNLLGAMEERNRLYAKILLPRHQTQILNRNNFSLLANIATAASQAENPSMINYKGSQADHFSNELKTIVTTYIMRRLQTSSRALITQQACFSKIELTGYMKLLNEETKKETNAITEFVTDLDIKQPTVELASNSNNN